MAIFTNLSPELDGVPVTIGDGTPKVHVLVFSGIQTPFWVRFDEATHGFRVDSVPFRVVRKCAKVEVFTFDPTGPECQ